MRDDARVRAGLWRFVAALLRNLAGGCRLALGLSRPRFAVSLIQLAALLALGWGFAFVADWRAVAGDASVSGWGVAADAARAYWWLAAIALIAQLSGSQAAFLRLAVACAAADPILWLAWLGANALTAQIRGDWPMQDFIWWATLAWQGLIMLRALWLMQPRARWRAPVLAGLYAALLYVTVQHSPDESLLQPTVAAKRVAKLDVEGTYYAQARLLDAALAGLAPGRPGVPDFFFVGFGAYANEAVFRREAVQVRDIVGRRLDTATRSLLLVNSRRTMRELPLANRSNLDYVLRSLGQRMDPDDDILFLFLTSHGREDGRLVVDFGELGLNDLEPRELRRILDETRIKWRVLVVSACFSGAFLPALESPRTLVITAAASDRSSFGCAHENTWTYFGEAFFRDALVAEPDMVAAFRTASRLIEERERQEGKEPSRPQISVGSEIGGHLARWADSR